jgi:hypothetical protein
LGYTKLWKKKKGKMNKRTLRRVSKNIIARITLSHSHHTQSLAPALLWAIGFSAVPGMSPLKLVFFILPDDHGTRDNDNGQDDRD